MIMVTLAVSLIFAKKLPAAPSIIITMIVLIILMLGSSEPYAISLAPFTPWTAANNIVSSLVHSDPAIIIIPIPSAYAQAATSESSPSPFLVRTNQDVFVPGDTLVVYGRSSANDTLVLTLIEPGGRAIRLDTVTADEKGLFSKQVIVWPKPSTNFVFGEYKLNVKSGMPPQQQKEVSIIFTEEVTTGSKQGIPITHTLAVKLDSPALVSTRDTFRIFVQVTFDGSLVNVDDPSALLGNSHVHSGNRTINLGDRFEKLHEGLYYADVNLDAEGAYIIHSIAFHRGILAHDSKVVTASSSSIGSIQESVDVLNLKLNSTNNTLLNLQSQLDRTSATLNETRSSMSASVSEARQAIAKDIESAKDTVSEIAQASGQINSIILPILALISVIIALQISLFARIRASYR